MPFELASIAPGRFERGIMAENLDLLNGAVSLLVKAALLVPEPWPRLGIRTGQA